MPIRRDQPCYLCGLREGGHLHRPATTWRREMPLCAGCDASWPEGTDPESRKADAIARAAALSAMAA